MPHLEQEQCMRKVFISNFLAVLILSMMTSAWAATDLQFTLVRNYLIVTLVQINEAEPVPFLLDTGTNTTLLHTEFAAQLGLRPIDRIELLTVAGAQAVPRAKLQSLSLGSQTATDLEVLFSELREIRSVLPTVRGVLGQNFLSQFNYLVDYSKRRISFVEESNAVWCGAQIPFAWQEGRILITVKAGLQLLLDSAIADLLLFEPTARQVELDLSQNSLRSMQLKSDLGSREVRQGRLRTFRVGEILFQHLPVTLFPLKPAALGRLENGLLPMSLFQSIYLNHQRGYVIFNPTRSPNQAAIPATDSAATIRW
jgi:predicted aspartyl protease